MPETLNILASDVSQLIGFDARKKIVGTIIPANSGRGENAGQAFAVKSAGDEFMGIYTFAGAVTRLREIGATLIQYTAHGDLQE